MASLHTQMAPFMKADLVKANAMAGVNALTQMAQFTKAIGKTTNVQKIKLALIHIGCASDIWDENKILFSGTSDDSPIIRCTYYNDQNSFKDSIFSPKKSSLIRNLKFITTVMYRDTSARRTCILLFPYLAARN